MSLFIPLSILPLSSGCSKGEEVQVHHVYDFLSHLHEAEIVTPRKEWARKASFFVQGELQPILFEHPNSQVTFKNVPVYKDARLQFGFGMNEEVWDKEGDGVLFQVLAIHKRTPKEVFSRYIDPKNNPSDRKWFQETLDLADFQGQKISIIFKTSCGPENNGVHDWAAWSNPVILSNRSLSLPEGKNLNIILISIDTLRPDHLGCYGYDKNTSPQIDNLSRDGVLFESAYSQSCWTLPSHMSILTSLYPETHTVRFDDQALPENRKTLAEYAKEKEYFTAGFVDGGYLIHKYGFDQGFDIYDDEGGRICTIGPKVIDFLIDCLSAKFFLFVHVFDVHAPYKPPPHFIEKFYGGGTEGKNLPEGEEDAMEFIRSVRFHDHHKFNPTDTPDTIRAAYDGGICYVDSKMGEIFDTLKKLRLYDDSLIVLTSDHGESLFDRHVYFGHGIFLFENEVRIPLIIKFPGNRYAGRRVKSLVESIDILPTILALAGIPAGPEIQGISLLPFVENPRLPGKEAVFGESSNTGLTTYVRTRDWKYISPFGKDLKQIFKDHLKPENGDLLRKYIQTGEMLFSILPDPGESLNRITQNAERALQLKARLSDFQKKNRAKASFIDRTCEKGTKGAKSVELTPEEKEMLRKLGYIPE